MKPFHCISCGDCCGPVPVNQLELQRIKKSVARMPKSKIDYLRNQKRDRLTCLFRDIEKDECSVYSVRPEICKMFGFYEKMVCPHNSEHATIKPDIGKQRLTKGGKPAGILTLQIKWETFFS